MSFHVTIITINWIYWFTWGNTTYINPLLTLHGSLTSSMSINMLMIYYLVMEIPQPPAAPVTLPPVVPQPAAAVSENTQSDSATGEAITGLSSLLLPLCDSWSSFVAIQRHAYLESVALTKPINISISWLSYVELQQILELLSLKGVFILNIKTTLQNVTIYNFRQSLNLHRFLILFAVFLYVVLLIINKISNHNTGNSTV